MEDPLRQMTFEVGDGTTRNYAVSENSGDPLVLLHGWFDRWQRFLPILPFLSQEWTVYALDHRGHGGSSAVPGEYRPQDYVQDAEAFLETVVRRPAVLVGHSLGGWVALNLAARHPDWVRAVVVGDSPLSVEQYVMGLPEDAGAPFRPMVEIAKLVAGLEETADAWNASSPLDPSIGRLELHSWVQSLRRIDAETLRLPAEGRSREYMEDIGLPEALAGARCPTLLIQADPKVGGLMPDADVEHALEVLANGYHVKLAGLDHSLGLSTWECEGLLRALATFLELV